MPGRGDARDASRGFAASSAGARRTTSETVAGASSLDNDIQTNVSSVVKAAIATAGTTSLYSRITFNAADLASLTSLTLRMQYDSGYVAYLNGVEIASSNAPMTTIRPIAGSSGTRPLNEASEMMRAMVGAPHIVKLRTLRSPDPLTEPGF